MGFHLKAGQWILQNHAFPQKDLFTYTVNQNDYTDLHWFYQVISYTVYQLSGYRGLSLLHLGLILAAFLLTTLRLRLTQAPHWTHCLLLLPAIMAMEMRFLMRPEVVSWILLILTLLILDLRLNHDKNFLYFLPLIQVLWVNVEGLFILGWVAMAAYLLTNWFQYRRTDRQLLRYSLFACAATLLNPYFLQGVAFPFVLFTRLQSSNIFKQYISEFQSPWNILRPESVPFFPALPIYTYRVLSLVLLLLIGLTFKNRKLHELALPVAFFFLSVAAIRNVPLFFWVALPIAAASLGDIISRKPFRKMSEFIEAKKNLAFGTALLILLLSARVLTGAYYISDRRVIHPGLGLNLERYPVKAAEFMVQNQLNGRLLNDLGFGGWLVWKGPGLVFIDGRLEVMREDIFTQYRDSFYTGGLAPLTTRWNTQLILFDHMLNSQWPNQLRAMPNWRLIYFDDVCALYARNDYATRLPPVNWMESWHQAGLSAIPNDADLTHVASLPSSAFGHWLEGFFRPQFYPMPLFRLGAFAYENSQFELAKNFFLEMLKETNGKYYEVYFNLAATYGRLGRKDLADLCYQKVLEIESDHKAARQKLGQL